MSMSPYPRSRPINAKKEAIKALSWFGVVLALGASLIYGVIFGRNHIEAEDWQYREVVNVRQQYPELAPLIEKMVMKGKITVDDYDTVIDSRREADKKRLLNALQR